MYTQTDIFNGNQTNIRLMSNREMASILFNIATALKQSGNTNPYRTAAYERGARALMGLRREARGVLQAEEKIAFRRRQHIGVKLQSKIREMATTGLLNQYHEMLADLPSHQREFLLVPGIGPKMADALFASLGIASAEALIRAARDGSLSQVRGFGRKRLSQIAAMSLASDALSVGQLSLFAESGL